jgi:hypothetical protein
MTGVAATKTFTLIAGMSLSGRFSPLPTPTITVAHEDIERQVMAELPRTLQRQAVAIPGL